MKYTVRPLNGKKYYDTVDVKAIVLHTDLGVYRGTYSWLNQIEASYHLYVRRDANEIVEFVPLDKGAWHSGRYNQPNERVKELFKGKNPNRYSIGICYENGGSKAQYPTEAQKALVASFIVNNGLSHLPLIAHREIALDKPREVYAFRDGIKDLIKEVKTCDIKKFSTREVINDIIRRFSGKI